MTGFRSDSSRRAGRGTVVRLAGGRRRSTTFFTYLHACLVNRYARIVTDEWKRRGFLTGASTKVLARAPGSDGPQAVEVRLELEQAVKVLATASQHRAEARRARRRAQRAAQRAAKFPDRYRGLRG